MNSTGTSPTYSDTPLAFQMGKFILVLPICAIAAMYIWNRRLSFARWALAALILCMSAYPIAKLIGAGEANAAYLNVAFWPIAALILVLAVRGISTAALDRYFSFVFFFAVASEVVQILLFLTIGRLPALAYAGTFSIRFGSFLDDPNGSPALWYLLMGWAYYRYAGLRLIVAEGALLVCLLLTQSLTALGFLGLLALFLVGKYFLHKPNPVWIICFCLLIGTLIVFVWAPLTTVGSMLVEDRIGSIDQHLSQVSGTNTNLGLNWLSGVSPYTPYESWWVGSMINFGIAWYLLSVAIVGTLDIAVFRAFRRARSRQQKSVFCGILLLAVYFTFGNANLPLFMIFPINFLFFFFTSLIFFERIWDDNGPQPELPARRASVPMEALDDKV
jgi:hypothetical protein